MFTHLTDEQVEEVRERMTELDDHRTDPLIWLGWEQWAERFLRELVKEADKCQSTTQ